MTIPFKPLDNKKFWVGLWLFAIAVVVVLSLIPPPLVLLDLPKNSDKGQHFMAYSLLAFSATQLFYRGRFLWVVSLLLVFLGISLEWAQGVLTTTRMADPWDALANTLGVALGLATGFTPLGNILLRLQPKRLNSVGNTI